MECKRVTWLSPIPQPLCPVPSCAACPKIASCDQRQPRQLALDNDFNVLPVAPVCQLPVAEPTRSPPQWPESPSKDKALCVASPKRYYDDSLYNVQPLEEYRYRWKNETCYGPDRLTGYKTLPFAKPIPRYEGFKPRFPHPLPKPHPSPTTIELTATMKEKLRCPNPCAEVCQPYRRGTGAICVSQLHPYIPYSPAVKITNTW